MSAVLDIVEGSWCYFWKQYPIPFQPLSDVAVVADPSRFHKL